MAGVTKAVPAAARCVVVGGGVAGVSAAYHLAQRGWTDTVLLERDRLTSGTTWSVKAPIPPPPLSTASHLSLLGPARAPSCSLHPWPPCLLSPRRCGCCVRQTASFQSVMEDHPLLLALV